MAYVQITEAQANALRALRPLKTVDTQGHKDARRALFVNIRTQLGIPDDIVLSVEVDDPAAAMYRVLKARPPKSKSQAYVPLQAGADGRYVQAAATRVVVQWAALPVTEVAALLQEQGETMEKYRVVGPYTPVEGDVRLPAGEDDGVELLVTSSNEVLFRLPSA